jgi:hypothetical protein
MSGLVDEEMRKIKTDPKLVFEYRDIGMSTREAINFKWLFFFHLIK